MNEEIQTKLFERYIKGNAKNIKIITVKEERVGFFDGKILEDNTFKIDKTKWRNLQGFCTCIYNWKF